MRRPGCPRGDEVNALRIAVGFKVTPDYEALRPADWDRAAAPVGPDVRFVRRVKAGVAWYGRLVGAPSALTPKHPLDLAADIKAPVLGLYGGQDSGIPLTTVNQMKDALAAAGTNANAAASQFVVYPDAPHAFHADYRPSYRKEPAQDGFNRALDWFKTHGVA